jgi:hypothetical protein
MKIKNWHYGKIILLWVWCIFFILMMIQKLESADNLILGIILIVLIFCIPIVMSIITWKWLSGKEKVK